MSTCAAQIKAIESGKYASIFKTLYGMNANAQEKRYVEAIKQFMEHFPMSKDSDIAIFSAPGRTEIGGNHTDHQHGVVLAGAVNLDVIAVVAKRDDMLVQAVSEGFQIQDVDMQNLCVQPSEVGTSESLIRGVSARLQTLQYKICGFQAYISSDVLHGSGLSSSAAFEVLLGTIQSHLCNEGSIDPIVIAQVGQYAENVYFQKPCGLMDQMASSVGGFVYIDFADTEAPIVEKIQFDFAQSGYHLCVVDTRGSHADLTAEYAAIPYEMKQIAKYFGKEYLREVDEDNFYLHLSALREACGDRAVLRAIHLFNENLRVKEEVAALKANNFETFQTLIKESGSSSFQYLQNVYTTTDIHTQNVSLALAVSESILRGVGVCRVHGGGFAGTIQAFVPHAYLGVYEQSMSALFGEGSCYVLQIRSSGGIQVV